MKKATSKDSQLEDSKLKFKLIYEGIYDGIMIMDENSTILDVNPALTEITNIPKEKLIGQTAFTLAKTFVGFKQLPNVLSLAKQHINKQPVKRYEFDYNGKILEFSSKDWIHNQNIVIVRDITEQRKISRTIIENEHKFRLIFDNSPLGIYIATTDGVIVDCNKSLLNILGSPSIEATKAINVLTFPPLVQNGYADKFKQCIVDGSVIEFEVPYKTKWHKEVFLHSFLIPLKDSATGIIEKVYTLIDDITERKRAEKVQKVLYNISNATIASDNLKELIILIRNELGSLIDTANFFVALYDDQTDLISLPFYSDEHDSYTTFPAGKTITSYVIKTGKALLADLNYLKKLEEKGYIEREGCDSLIWLGVPLKINGKITGAIVVQSYTDANAYDESDQKLLEFISYQISIAIHRKNAEDLLRKSEERFNLAMMASNDGLFDWDLVTNEIYYSERWKSILGYKNDELSNNIETWKALVHKQEGEESLLRLKEATEQKIPHYDVEFRMKHKDGHWVNILSRAQLFYDNAGRPIRSVGTHSDITEQKRAEKTLKDALKKAEESDKLKSAFLANMSHEIRTPMNGILGFASLLNESELTQNQIKQYVGIIQKSGVRMLNIINDLIDISKIEAGLVDVNLSSFDVYEQVNYLYNFFKLEAENKGLSLIVDQSINRLVIETDKEKLYAILTNLIKNAIKYTHEGNIVIGYEIKQDKSGDIVEFYVEDTGIGIPKDRQKAVFDRFVQADIEDKKVYEGAGLGLSITKAYVEMLGGTIRLESEENVGSKFYFTLPVRGSETETKELPEKTKEEKPKINSSKKINILIAEDEEVSYLYLTLVLKGLNVEIYKVNNGKEAVEFMKNNPDIDLILMDVKMPVMGGYEATRRIRIFNKTVKIIVETAYALAGDREKAIAAGCNDYIAKPIKKEELLNMINKLLLQ